MATAKTTSPAAGPALKQPRLFLLAIAILLTAAIFWWQQNQKPQPLAVLPSPSPEIKIPNFSTPPLKEEGDFLTQTLPQLEETITFSQAFVTRTTDSELKAFAELVSQEQRKNVWTMLGYYQLLYKQNFVAPANQLKTLPNLDSVAAADLDRTYVTAMIDYYEEVFKMGNQVLTVSDKEELQGFTRQLLASHSGQLATLVKWRTARETPSPAN